MKKHSLIGLITLKLFIISCGGPESESSSATKRRLTKNPIKLKKQIKLCSSSYGTFSTEEVINFSLKQFIGGLSINRNVLFKDMLRENFVESKSKMPITGTSYGEEGHYKARGVYDDYREVYRVKAGTREIDETTQRPLDLSVCPSVTDYNENTFEDSGLNVNYAITKTYNSIKEVDEGIDLKGVKVNIGPVKKVDIILEGGPRDGTDQYLYETDNASYNPQTLTITFLPQSKEYQKGTGSKVPYWEIPMVGSHEYGHHVFRTLYSDVTGALRGTINSCFHTRKIKGVVEISSATGKRDNKSNFALRSLNEGYADLIAYYTLDNNERGLKGVPCFTKNREVGVPNFGNGVEKFFFNVDLKSMNSTDVEARPATCNDPDFQEIHDVGAVFAYQANSIMSKYTTDKKVKLKILLTWLKDLAQRHRSIEGRLAGDVMFFALELMYKVAADVTDSPKKPVCSDMESSFYNHGISCRILN